MRCSLSTRLIICTAASLVIVSALVLAALLALFQWGPQLLLKQELVSNVEHIASGMQFDSSGKFARVILPPRRQDIYNALQLDDIYRILDRNGVVLASSDGAKEPLLPQYENFNAAGLENASFVLKRLGVTLHVLTKQVMQGGQVFYVQVGRSERMHNALLGNNGANYRLAVPLAVIVAMLVFTVVVWATFERALRPLRAASEAASRIESNSLHARLSTHEMPKEMLPLVDAFNKALDRLELGYRAQQEFLATVAHELKTPLALIRGQVELDGSENQGLLLKDIDRMARQVHQLLHLAEVSDRRNFISEDIDPTAVVTDAVEHLMRLADRLGVFIRLNLPDKEMLLHADGSALFVLVKNLLENALLHSAQGSEILITLSQEILSIRDHGKGIAADDVQFLFKRFWRGSDRSDIGAGLGLAICREITLVHGWELIVHHDRSPGAEFLVSFR